MADGAVNLEISRKAAVDLSGSQYYAVRLDETSGEVKLGNATSSTAGIVQNDPVTNRAAGIRYQGESYACTTGTIAIMDRLAADDSGILTPTTTDQDEYIAIALEVHTEDGTSKIQSVIVVGFGGLERSSA